jgi:hypothetical protein
MGYPTILDSYGDRGGSMKRNRATARRVGAVLLSSLALAAGGVAFGGCGDDDNEGPAEEAGKAIDTAGEEAGEAVETGADEIDDDDAGKDDKGGERRGGDKGGGDGGSSY